MACQSLIQFKEKSSSTYVNLKTASDPITYADGSSVQGTLVKDTVAVGNLSVAGFELIDANSVSSAGGNIDGIVGMALVRAGGKGGDLFFERLAASGQLASSVFSYYVDERY